MPTTNLGVAFCIAPQIATNFVICFILVYRKGTAVVMVFVIRARSCRGNYVI
jgi:hypothetical protein